MEAKPTKAYVYQPGSISKDGPKFAVAGPGSELWKDARMGKEAAKVLADYINKELREAGGPHHYDADEYTQ